MTVSAPLPASVSVDSTNGDGEGPTRKVIFVGIGGASSSGKTTLGKYLREIIPGCVILHQDDFAFAQELIPMHPVHGVQDWDDPEGAIDWPKMVSFLSEVKRTGKVPAEHASHDHMNISKPVPVEPGTVERWKEKFAWLDQEKKRAGEEVFWVVVDGFLLYWDFDVVDLLDVRVLLRSPHDVLKERRHARHGYHTAAGGWWRDPPNYWEQIVWPAYVKAHEQIVEDGDVEKGKPNGKVKGLEILEGTEMSMDATVNHVCERLAKLVE